MSAQNPAHAAKVTVRSLHQMKQRGEKIPCLTAYDASFARISDQAGVDVVLVGDSLGMVIQGLDTTLPVTMEHMIYHGKSVSQGLKRALLMVDMPFMSHISPEQGLLNAGRLMKEAGAHIVKLEGGAEQVGVVEALASHGIPVCAHLGLQPQRVHKLGGYRVQGRDNDDARRMQQEAQMLEQAGADVLLLECVPCELASRITASVSIPVIGIGAGVDCDGQILVLHDILGITAKPPRFSHDFLQGAHSIQDAIGAYVQAVREGRFPTEAHWFAS